MKSSHSKNWWYKVSKDLSVNDGVNSIFTIAVNPSSRVGSRNLDLYMLNTMSLTLPRCLSGLFVVNSLNLLLCLECSREVRNWKHLAGTPSFLATSEYLILDTLSGLVLSTATCFPDFISSVHLATHFCHDPRVSLFTWQYPLGSRCSLKKVVLPDAGYPTNITTSWAPLVVTSCVECCNFRGSNPPQLYRLHWGRSKNSSSGVKKRISKFAANFLSVQEKSFFFPACFQKG